MSNENQNRDKNNDIGNHDRQNKLELFMNYYGRYHDHKETMAWLATTFYVGGAVFVTNATHGLACHDHPWQVALATLLVLAGVLAFLFVRWQFNRRQEASERVDDCYRQLLKKYNEEATSGQRLNWPNVSRTDPHETEWLSYIAIAGITVIGATLLNIC